MVGPARQRVEVTEEPASTLANLERLAPTLDKDGGIRTGNADRRDRGSLDEPGSTRGGRGAVLFAGEIWIALE
jgi:hypothetical protein